PELSGNLEADCGHTIVTGGADVQAHGRHGCTAGSRRLAQQHVHQVHRLERCVAAPQIGKALRRLLQRVHTAKERPGFLAGSTGRTMEI
ncbi:hypothetical protein LXJ58_32240, partial [Escherichia coli]|nr:hypothetical protein [Escherichia coli]